MICPSCQAVVGKIRFDAVRKAWDCAECDGHRQPHVAPWLQERIVKAPGFGWVTRAQAEEWKEKEGYIEREVDAKGDVTTRPISRKAGRRLYFQMGG